MDPIKELLEECQRRNWVPKHECHFTAGEMTRKINGKTVIIKLTPKCMICGKVSDKPTNNGKWRFTRTKGLHKVKGDRAAAEKNR